RHIRPQRIGHGILAARDPRLVELLAESGTVLEISPTSNLLTRALADEEELVRTLRIFVEGGVRFTVATDGPEMMNTRLQHEFELLIATGALSAEEAERANRTGHEASFLPPGGLDGRPA
ncbi:MAG: adenosine deaminase, partial [Gaiellaceae bacterium]